MSKKIVIFLTLSIILGSAAFIIIKNISKPTINISSSVAYKSFDDLVNDSELIVKGKVISKSKSVYSNPDFSRGKDIRNILQTDISIGLEKIYKGIPYDKESIVLRVDKGETEDVIYLSEDIPDYNIDEEYLFFLVKDTSDVARTDQNYYVVCGYTEGVFKEVNDKYQKYSSSDSLDIISEQDLEEKVK